VVVGMVVAEEGASLLTACERGYGKRTPMEDYPIKGRGGQGVINIRTEARNGKVIGVAQCREGDDVMFITESGMIVRTSANDMRPMGRNTMGVRLVNLRDDDQLVSLEVVAEEDLERFASEEVAEEAEGAAAEGAAAEGAAAEAGDAPAEGDSAAEDSTEEASDGDA